MRQRVVRELVLTTLREFLRSREAVFWTYGFPVLMAVVLGLAFSRDAPEPLRVAVVGAPAETLELLREAGGLEVRSLAAEEAEQALASASTDLIVTGPADAPVLTRDPVRVESRLAYAEVDGLLQRSAGRADPVPVVEGELGGSFERYIDLLIPGLIGLNLLGAGLWGIGFNLVDMRAKHLLRRLVVAPMLRAEFLLAFLLSRLGLVVIDALLILAFGMLAFDVPVRGSWVLLVAVIALSATAFTGVGLLVAARPRTIEGVAGIMNLVSMPMWLLCGSFFKTSYFPDFVQPLVQILPLTHANDALRAVMLQGAGVAEIWPQLAYLGGFAVAMFAAALRWFRWV